MPHRSYFPADYRAARSAFREAAENAGAELSAYAASSPGPDGKPLYTDVAVLGSASAPRLLLCNSATHGVEGFCGSGVFRGWLENEESRQLPDNVRVVLIHALNCHGFAWLRRVTEENVDLNRNFVSRPGVRNNAYGKLHRHLIPDRWDEKSVADLTRRLESYASKHGRFQLQAILTGGQFDHPDGIFYGGSEPTEAHLRFLKIIDNHVAGAEHLMYLDWHTGLGPYGTAELIGATRPGTPHGDRVQAWFANNLTSTTNGTSSSAPVTGTVGSGLRARLKDSGAEITSLTVEFGTYPPEEVLMAIIADNWLHLKGELDSDVGHGIKARLRRALYPDEDDWKELVWVRGKQLIHRAIRGLADL